MRALLDDLNENGPAIMPQCLIIDIEFTQLELS
jgi:hypothetical protein